MFTSYRRIIQCHFNPCFCGVGVPISCEDRTIIISARHKLDFQAHPDHPNAASAALVYNFDLDPEANWLPLIQGIFQKANPLIIQYKQVEICLISPSAIAFALGMAFSRAPHVTICHWFADSRYRAVFQLAEIERRLPFS